MLRQYADASIQPEGATPTWRLLWIYIPDFMTGGAMNTIKFIPKVGIKFSEVDALIASNSTETANSIYWQEDEACAGFVVSEKCDLRYDEMSLVTFTPSLCQTGFVKGCEYLVSYARIDMSYIKRNEAIWNFATTLFTIVFLSCIFIVFNRDTENVVVKPIKKVVQIIIRLAENPLKKPEQPKDEEETGEQMKTKMLELTIFKIGTLLQRGFGELGAQIVAVSLTQTDKGMDLNLPGRKVELIFSICRIRQFTETTDCLQDEIIVFVNKIVKIIHEVCSVWEGMPTKNYGEKYLLTWKLPALDQAIDKLELEEKERKKEAARLKALEQGLDPDEIDIPEDKESNIFEKGEDEDDEKPNIKFGLDDSVAVDKPGERTSLLELGDLDMPKNEIGKDGRIINKNEKKKPFNEMKKADILAAREEIADRVIISAVKTICTLQRANDLNAYSRHPRIQHTFGANYQIRISFAMHAGKAIEGSIGSEQKVDALYLSTDAQITQRIDELCEVYDRQILMTGELHHMLSDKAKNFTRMIDCINMNESKRIKRVSL